MLPVQTFQSQEVSMVMTYSSPLRPNGGVKMLASVMQGHPRNERIITYTTYQYPKTQLSQTKLNPVHKVITWSFLLGTDMFQMLPWSWARSMRGANSICRNIMVLILRFGFPHSDRAPVICRYADPRTFGSFFSQFLVWLASCVLYK